MLPLSVVIITKNEERNLPRCLESVAWADEVLVVDSGSTDATVDVARRHGARVLTETWRGFGPQKAFAALQAKHDWILSLDADECVPVELHQELERRFASLTPGAAYALPRKSLLWGRWIRHGGWFPDRQIRLFNRRFANWDQAPVHEKVQAKVYDRFEAPLEHYVFRDVAHQIDTNNRYSGLLAEKDVAAGKRFRLWKLIFKPYFKFLENYFWKRGFLDGLPGFVIAVNSAHSTLLRWVKIWEIERRHPGGQVK
ncbi:MAG: glycosyltransferase family 2 protein [Bdellovibrionaceae bacterium]|nr:glycosyltransferase family 2 protein [Pseudobdellovibrionaceae bacterium]